MTKKSRIIINNWTNLSDEMVIFYAHFAFKGDFAASRRIETRDGDLFIGVFHNKSSVSLDVRETSGESDENL